MPLSLLAGIIIIMMRLQCGVVIAYFRKVASNCESFTGFFFFGGGGGGVQAVLSSPLFPCFITL